MKAIEASVEQLFQGPGIKGLFEHIELCGRTCIGPRIESKKAQLRNSLRGSYLKDTFRYWSMAPYISSGKIGSTSIQS